MTKQNRTPKVRYYLTEFVRTFRKQLIEDDKREGDAWLGYTRAGQENAVFMKFGDYYDNFKVRGIPIPWLKVVGLAMIAWIREQHPELFPNGALVDTDEDGVLLSLHTPDIDTVSHDWEAFEVLDNPKDAPTYEGDFSE